MGALVRRIDRLQETCLRRRATVVDAFLLFNELDLLELRLQELWPVVDRFVVVEATFSHAGAGKPLFFADHRSRFAAYADKVVHHVVSDPPLDLRRDRPRDEEGRRLLERAQRDAIGAAVGPLRLRSHDVVLVSDVDEIPRPAAVRTVPSRLASRDVCVFVQRHHHRYLNHAWPGGGPPAWLGTVGCRYRTLRAVGAHRVRRGHDRAGVLRGKADPDAAYLEDGGWHLTWMGGAQACWTKAQNVIDTLDRASGLRDLGPPAAIRWFPADVSREECRELQAHYVAHAEAPAFTPLDFDRFEVDGDLPEHLVRGRERYRRWFFFTTGV